MSFDEDAKAPLLRSGLCTAASMRSDWYQEWGNRLRPVWAKGDPTIPVYTHRKMWEWLVTIEALYQRGMLAPGKRGLGFGVGQEPLAALFASFGVEIVATDVDVEVASRDGWADTGQHAASLEQLNKDGLCDPAKFEKLVSLRTVDMNDIPVDLRGQTFDFTWSSCAFEHLGSIVKGQEFVLTQMECLKPGGVGVHTTEYNLTSNRITLDHETTVLFRRRDIEWLVNRLRLDGHLIDVDFDPGSDPADRHVDFPPFTNTHLKVDYHGLVVTSLALIIERNPYQRPLPPPRFDSLRYERALRRRADKAVAWARAKQDEKRTRQAAAHDAPQ